MNLTWLKNLLNQSQAKTRNSRLVRGAVLLFWAICLLFILWGGWKSRDLILPYLAGVDYSRIPGVFFSYLGSLLAAVVAWSAIMHTFEKKLGWWKNTQIFSITLAARRLPGTFWYIGGRMMMYQQLGVPKKTVLFASSIELLVTLITGGAIGLGLLLYSGTDLPVQVIALILVGILLGTFLLYPASRKLLVKSERQNWLETVKAWDVLVWLGASCVMWVMGGVMLSQIISAFQAVPANQVYLIVGSWALSGAAGVLTFFLPSTFGVTEITVAALLSQIMPLPLAGVISILTRIITIFFEVLLSAIFYPLLVTMPIYKMARNAPEKSDPANLAEAPKK